MYIKRDINQLLINSRSLIQVLIGPRQCGKSTLFSFLFMNSQESNKQAFKEITFDDLQLRQLANQDPALFLQQFSPPLLLDEIQYVPNLFPELKKRVDELKRRDVFEATSQSLVSQVLYRLTGSNQRINASRSLSCY